MFQIANAFAMKVYSAVLLAAGRMRRDLACPMCQALPEFLYTFQCL